MPKVIIAPKELQIIKLICKQKSSEEIATALGMALRTVEMYRVQIRRKIKARNAAGIVIWAIKNGVFKVVMEPQSEVVSGKKIFNTL